MSSSVQFALQALKKVATKGKTKKSLLENINNISSAVVLLNSPALSPHAFDKLVSVLRAPLVPLYSSYTDAALNVSASVLNKTLNDGIRPCLLEGNRRDANLQAGWERVANSLLSGVLDFLENEGTEKSKTSIAKAFFSPICNFFFSGDPNFQKDIDANLRCTVSRALANKIKSLNVIHDYYHHRYTNADAHICIPNNAFRGLKAYTLLSETAAQHNGNQLKLRDCKFMGGRSLGIAIFETRDFAILEVLLNLFARLLPSSSTSKHLHVTFIQDVFLNSFTNDSDCGKYIVKLLEGVTAKDWEETATKVFDILSLSNISFPQPFDVNEVIVCENTYPQPELSDRFYIDRTAFFINVRQEDGMYESLQVLYETVAEVKILPAKGKTTTVTVQLKKSPKIGDQLLSTSVGGLSLQVDICNDDITRFNAALRHRNLVISRSSARRALPQKSSVTESSARLEFEEDGMEWKEPFLSSVKVMEVQKFYESEPVDVTNDEALQAKSNAMSDNSIPRSERTAKKLAASARSPVKTKLKDSIFGGIYEELSDLGDEKTKVLPKAKATEGRKNASNHSVSKPNEIINLADNESEMETDLTTLNNNGKKGLLGCKASDYGDGKVAEGGPKAENGSSAKGILVKDAAAKKATRATVKASYASRPKDKSQIMKSSKMTTDVEKKPSSRRSRRAAAVLATARITSTVPGNGESDVKPSKIVGPGSPGVPVIGDDDSKDYQPSVNSPMDAPTSTISKSTLKKNTQITRNSQTKEASSPVSAPQKHIDLHHSSPLSKISRMKTKNPTAETKTVKSIVRKRARALNPSADEDEPSRKKSRVDVENNDGVSEADEEGQSRTLPFQDDVSSRLLQIYEHSGRKTKASLAQQETTVRDQLPSDAPPPDNMGPNDTLSLPIDSRKSTNSVRSSAIKTAVKKENTAKPDGPTKTLSKAILSTRAPLQTITVTHDPKMASDEDPVSMRTTPKKKLRQRPLDMMNPRTSKELKRKTITTNGTLPSLEDILLVDATVEKAEFAESLGNADFDDLVANTEVPNVFSTSPTVTSNKVVQTVDDQREVGGIIVDGAELRTLSSKNDRPAIKSFVSKILKNKTLPTTEDSEIKIDSITRDDAKEVLQSDHARCARSNLKINTTRQLPGIPAVVYGNDSSAEDDLTLKQHKAPRRPQVKFDDKPRYRSASFHSSVDRESVEDQPLIESASISEFRMIMHLESSLLTGRNYGISEGASLSLVAGNQSRIGKHDGQLKKEPGMEEIINVLDAIQNAVASNIANRSRGIRSDIRTARDRLLQEAIADLHEMREESFGHFNSLFSLETDYANINRRLGASYEVVTGVNEDICTFVRQALQSHDRGLLSQKIPQTLFVSALPETIMKFTR